MMMRTSTALVAALAAAMLATGTAGAVTDSACSALGGTVGADQTCHARTENDHYVLDFRFPVDYADQGALTQALSQERDDFVDWFTAMKASPMPGELDIIGRAYRSVAHGACSGRLCPQHCRHGS